MNALNEALDKILKPEQEVAKKKQPVDKKLEKILKESVSQVNLKNCKNNHDKTIAYQRALQEAIEKVNPDKSWHDITSCDIYATLLETQNNTDAVIERILTESKAQKTQATNVSTNSKKVLNETKSVAKKQGKKSLKEGTTGDRWKLGGGFPQELDSFILKQAQKANAPAMTVKGFFDQTSFYDGKFDVDTYVDEDNKLIADRVDGETGEVVAHCEYPGFGDRKLLELEEILRGRSKNTRYKEDEIIIDRNEDGVIGKMHDLRSKGYESSGAGDGSIIFTKWKTESCNGKNCGKVVKSRKNIKESLSYGEMVAISDEWDKFKKKKGDNSPNTAWEFIETECKGAYDTEDEKWDVFAYIGSIEDVDEVVDLTNESKCGKRSRKVVKESLKRKFTKRVSEALKKVNKRNLTEGLMADAEDAYWDLYDRVCGWIDDGYSVDEAVERSIDDGLIYSEDIISLAYKYGVIDDSELLNDMYDELFSDLCAEAESYVPDTDESLKEGKVCKRRSKKNIDEASENGRKLFTEYNIYVGDRIYETSHTKQRADEIVAILSDMYPNAEVKAVPYRHYESGSARSNLERIIAKQLQDYGESLKEGKHCKRPFRKSLKESTPKDLMRALKQTPRFRTSKHNPAYNGAFDFEQSDAVEVTKDDVLAAKKRGEDLSNYFIIPGNGWDVYGDVIRVNDAGGYDPYDSSVSGLRANSSLKKMLDSAKKIYKYDVKKVGSTHPERFSDPEERRANNRLGHARGTDHLSWDEDPKEYGRLKGKADKDIRKAKQAFDSGDISRKEMDQRIAVAKAKQPGEYEIQRAAKEYNNYKKNQADARYYASNKKLTEPIERLHALRSEIDNLNRAINRQKSDIFTAKLLGGNKFGQGSNVKRAMELRSQIASLQAELDDLEARYDAEKGQAEIKSLENELSGYEKDFEDAKKELDKLLRRKTESFRKSGRKSLKEADDFVIFEQEPDDWYGVDFETYYDPKVIKDLGIVISGNDDFRDYGDPTLIEIVKGDYTDDDLWNEESGYYEDYDVLAELEKVTGKKYDKSQMTGYAQREWQDIYYPVENEKFVDDIETYYMGKYDGFVDVDEDTLYIIPHDISWKGTEAIKKELADQSDVPADKIRIRKFTGYTRTPNYEEESLKEAKHDLYVNGEYICSSNRYKTAKEFKSKVLSNKGVEYAGDASGKLTRKDIKDTDKVAVKRDKSRNESLKESYYGQEDVLKMVSPKTRARLNKIITNQKQKYGNDMDIYVNIKSPYKAYLSYGEGGADFVKGNNGNWEHDYGYIKIDSSLANAILSDVCRATGVCDESLKEDTVKQGSQWTNKGKEGTHGKFKTKKEADAQRKAMFANGYKGESLKESKEIDRKYFKTLIKYDTFDPKGNYAILNDGNFERAFFAKDDEEAKKEFRKIVGESIKEGIFGNDYDPADGWTEDDIAKHKGTDWKARDYADLDVGDEFKGDVRIYRYDSDPEVKKDVTFHKFLRSNPTFPPYYKAIDLDAKGVVGPMYDGRKHNTYDIHDRYEDQKTYDILSM